MGESFEWNENEDTEYQNFQDSAKAVSILEKVNVPNTVNLCLKKLGKKSKLNSN